MEIVAIALNQIVVKMKILILFTGNSCRSQMVGGFLKAFDENLHVYSADTKPSENVHPKAIKVMC